MTLTINHPFVCTIAESGSSGTPGGPVGPNEWNAGLNMAGTVNALIGLNSSGVGTDLAALTWNASTGVLTMTPPTTTHTLLLGTGASNNQYCAIGFNGSLDGSTGISIAGGGSIDSAVYHNVPTAGNFQFSVNGTKSVMLQANGNIQLGSSSDVNLYRDAAAQVLALANGTSAAAFRVYNTTDQTGSGTAPTNYERGVFDWTTTANTLTIGTQKGGSGSTRNIQFVVGGVVNATFGIGPATKTTAYTVVDADEFLIFNGGASITVTLQSAAGYNGRQIFMKTIAAFTVISASSNVVPRTSATAGTAILAATAGSWAMLVSDGTNWVIMAGA